MSKELACADFRFATGPRTGRKWEHEFIAERIVSDNEHQQFVITAREPSDKGHGVEIQVAVGYSVIPSLMEAIMKALLPDPALYPT